MKNCTTVLFLLFFQTILISQSDWIRSNPGGGGAVSMIIGTADGTILSGSDLSGVYKSEDDGISWTPIGSVQGLTQTHITALAAHPTDGDIFFIGTGVGIFKTTDGGETVTESNINVVNGKGYVETIEIATTNSNIGYASHHEWWDTNLTFLKTLDGGANWSIVSTSGLPAQGSMLRMIVHPTDEDLIFGLFGKGRYNCSDPWLYKSEDGGANWVRIANSLGEILDFDVHPTDPEIVYASTFLSTGCQSPIWSYVGGNESTGALFKSINGGDNFSEIGEHTGFINVGFNADNIAVTNFLFPIDWSTTPPTYNSLMGTWKTTNGGTTWTKTGNLQNWEHGWPVLNYAYTSSFYGLSKTVSKDKFSSGNYFAAYGGYAWVTSDGGDIFKNRATQEVSAGKFLSRGMDNINGNTIDVSDQNPNTIYVGYYDLGFWYSRDRGLSWTFSIPDPSTYPNHVWGAGGGSNVNFVINDPERENVVWATFGADNVSTDGAVFKSTAYGENWQMSNTGLEELGNTTHGMSLDINSPVSNRTLFVTQDGDVFKSIDDGATWTEVLVNGGLKFTEVDKMNSQLIYAGGESGFWKSTDGGATWTEIGLVEMRYEQQIPNSIMRDDIVPTFDSEFETPPIEAWNGVFEIKADKNNADRVYVSVYGPNKGVYRSDDAGITWTKLKTDNFSRGIAIHPNNSNVIYISSGKAYHSGDYNTGSNGFSLSDDGGSTWTSVNANMSWTFGGRMEVDNGPDPRVWAWSPGTGVQYAESLLPLPVGLVSFDGEANGCIVNLKWITESEENFSHYEVEWSQDGNDFKSIKQITGSVMSINTKYYQHSDNSSSIENYYRLKMVDLDGQIEYSNIIYVNNGDCRKSETVIYPNPIYKDQAAINFSFYAEKNQAKIEIVDMLGIIVKEIKLDVIANEINKVNIDIASFSTGTYFIYVEGRVGASKFVISR